jgi:hypothetical protein
LAGLPEASTIVEDDPVAGVKQHRDLLFPGGSIEGEAVDQNDGLTGAVVLVVDVDAGRVLVTNGDVGHSGPPIQSV